MEDYKKGGFGGVWGLWGTLHRNIGIIRIRALGILHHIYSMLSNCLFFTYYTVVTSFKMFVFISCPSLMVL